MNERRNMGETSEGTACGGAFDNHDSNRMEPKPMKTIEDLVQYFADHGEVIHTEGECVYAVDYYIECAFDDKEEFIRLFIDGASSEQLFTVRKIIEKSFSASDALDKFQFYFEDELHELLHEELIHQAGN